MGIYPAVDITNSVSRVMNEIIKQDHLEIVKKFRAHVSSYVENKDLLMMGGYARKGYIAWWGNCSLAKIIDFISQKENEKLTTAIVYQNYWNYIMKKIKKEIRLFKLLNKLKKRDLYNHLNNVNLLNEELEKTDQLLFKIDNIIQENSGKNDKIY